MIDFKNAAAGDTDISDDKIESFRHKLRCNRCGKDRFWGKVCPGCEELDLTDCSSCKRKFGIHILGYGSRTRRRQWYCDKNDSIICYPENDPVRQVGVNQTDIHKPRIIWEDVIEK